MSRKRIASRCQFHMISTLHHDLVARLDAAQDLYFLAIACTEFHLLLLVTFLTLLDVDEIQALLFGECFYWKDDAILHILRKKIDFYKRAWNDFTLVVETESDWYIERTCRLAIREQLAIQGFEFVYLIVIWSLEVGRSDVVEILVIAFRYIGTEEEAVVLSHGCQWLTY